MRKIILIIVIISILFLISNSVEASRISAPEVQSLVYKGIKFIAPNTPEKMSYIEAWDIKTNTKLWELKVYEVKINPELKADVQWIFITSLYISVGKLIVVNEAGERYEVDIEAKKVVKEGMQTQRSLSKEQIIEIAKSKAEELGFNLKEMTVFYDEENKKLKEHLKRTGVSVYDKETKEWKPERGTTPEK